MIDLSFSVSGGPCCFLTGTERRKMKLSSKSRATCVLFSRMTFDWQIYKPLHRPVGKWPVLLKEHLYKTQKSVSTPRIKKIFIWVYPENYLKPCVKFSVSSPFSFSSKEDQDREYGQVPQISSLIVYWRYEVPLTWSGQWTENKCKRRT